MADSYRKRYEQTLHMLEKYQDEVVPKLRQRIQTLENQQADTLVRCGQCRNSFVFTDLRGNSALLCTEMGRRGLSETDFCSLGRRRDSHGKL